MTAWDSLCKPIFTPLEFKLLLTSTFYAPQACCQKFLNPPVTCQTCTELTLMPKPQQATPDPILGPTIREWPFALYLPRDIFKIKQT